MSVESAITDAFNGIEVKDVVHGGRHKFNLHPIKVERSQGHARAVGQISHQLRFRTDDQVRFEVIKRPGQEASIEELSISRGGLGRMVGLDQDVSDFIGKEIDGSWEGACRDIVVRIAARL
jgi:hypothetical protein